MFSWKLNPSAFPLGHALDFGQKEEGRGLNQATLTLKKLNLEASTFLHRESSY